jgi:plasmid stabilization system protein ParE
MRIIWSDDAIKSVDNTADYIEDNFGVDRSIEFYDEVLEQADSLVQFPQKGPVDEDLKGGKYEYRSLEIGKLSRLIYRIDGETIRILYLWNTRRNPITLRMKFD